MTWLCQVQSVLLCQLLDFAVLALRGSSGCIYHTPRPSADIYYLSYTSKKCLNSVYNGEKIVVLERNPDNKCFWFTTGTDRHLSNVHVPRLFDTPILKTRPLAHLRDARPTLRAARISNDPSVEPREGLRPVVHVPKVFAFGPTLKRRLFVFLPCFRRNWTP